MAEKQFKLEIISPDRLFYDGAATMVEYKTTEGEVGVYADHVAMTQIIAPGKLTITEADGTKKEAALISGFVEILADKITILAETVEWPDDIDKERAEAAKKRAEERLAKKDSGSIDVARAELALQRALIRLSF
ncbi:MAG: ATP synthase F1 subunit epsilon [Lachnospiraceae bacterium]|nr:ATP synthase F1 subunit epsilon [Lachnospiraceae bacterium]